MKCHTFIKHREDLFNPAATSSWQYRLREHMKVCDKCRQYHMELGKLEQLLQQAPVPEPPDHLETRIKTRVLAEINAGSSGYPRHWKRILVPAVPVLACIIIAGIFLLPSGKEDPALVPLDRITLARSIISGSPDKLFSPASPEYFMPGDLKHAVTGTLQKPEIQNDLIASGVSSSGPRVSRALILPGTESRDEKQLVEVITYYQSHYHTDEIVPESGERVNP